MSTSGESSAQVARIAAVLGAVGSEAALLRAGYRGEANMPVILLVLFTGWVLAPFAAFFLAANAARNSAPSRTALHRVMLLVTLISLAIYGVVALSAPRPKPAVIFLSVPLGSLVLMAIAVAIAASKSPKLSS